MSSNLIGATIASRCQHRNPLLMTELSPALRRPRPILGRLVIVGVLAMGLAGCNELAGGGLAPGLVAQMDAPGASLDRPSAIAIINQYRGTVGAGQLTGDPTLDTTAQGLAQAYAKTGKSPTLPPGASAIRTSAGYGNFAETFSGWRNNPADAAALATAGARRAGIAAVYDASSSYGVYWVLVLAG
jgi:hypothetical protein